MKAGDILFVRGKGLISRVIRWFDKGDFSHVAIALSDTHILEAQYYTKVRIVPNFYEDYEIISLPYSLEEKSLLLPLGVSLTGKWYNYRLILALVLNRDFKNPHALICTEVILAMLMGLGKLKTDPKLYKPNELYVYLITLLKEIAPVKG